MKLKRQWVKFLIIVGVLVGSVTLFIFWRDGAFMNLQGQLILSAPTHSLWRTQDSQKIYSVPLSGQYMRQTYYENSDYNEIRLSEKNDMGEFYSGRNIKGNYYTVLLVQNDSAQELLRFPNPVYFPSLRNNSADIVFFGRSVESQYEYYLHRYNIQQKTITILSKVPVLWWSRPIFSHDGSIIFSTLERDSTSSPLGGGISFYKSTIMQMQINGELNRLVNGQFPTWLEIGKIFFYHDRSMRALRVYDLETRNAKTVSDKINVISNPALSWDKQYLAFFELIHRHEGDYRPWLQIISINGWEKLTIISGEVSRIQGSPIADIIWSQ